MGKHRNADYSLDSLIGAGADITPRPDEQAAVTPPAKTTGNADV